MFHFKFFPVDEIVYCLKDYYSECEYLLLKCNINMEESNFKEDIVSIHPLTSYSSKRYTDNRVAIQKIFYPYFYPIMFQIEEKDNGDMMAQCISCNKDMFIIPQFMYILYPVNDVWVKSIYKFLQQIDSYVKETGNKNILCCSKCLAKRECDQCKTRKFSDADIINYMYSIRKKKYKLSNSEFQEWFRFYFKINKQSSKNGKCVSCLMHQCHCIECYEPIHWKDNIQIYFLLNKNKFDVSQLITHCLSCLSQKKITIEPIIPLSYRDRNDRNAALSRKYGGCEVILQLYCQMGKKCSHLVKNHNFTNFYSEEKFIPYSKKDLSLIGLYQCMQCQTVVCPSHREQKWCIRCYAHYGRKWLAIYKSFEAMYPKNIVDLIMNKIT